MFFRIPWLLLNASGPGSFPQLPDWCRNIWRKLFSFYSLSSLSPKRCGWICTSLFRCLCFPPYKTGLTTPKRSGWGVLLLCLWLSPSHHRRQQNRKAFNLTKCNLVVEQEILHWSERILRSLLRKCLKLSSLIWKWLLLSSSWVTWKIKLTWSVYGEK